MKAITAKIMVIATGAWLAFGAAWWLLGDAKLLFIAKAFAFNVLVVCLILSSAWAAGDLIKRFLGHPGKGLEGFLVAVGLGLGVDVYLLFLLGLTSLLYKTAILCIIGLPLVLNVRRIGKFLEGKPWQRDFPRVSPTALEWVTLFSLASVVGYVLLCSLVPEIFYDSLYYHLGFPELYLIRHKMEIYPYAAHSAMPSNVDLLFVMPLAFAGSESVRLLHTLFYLGCGLWVYTLAARYYGRHAGLIAAVLLLTMPGVCWMAGVGAVDLGVTFWGLGAMSLLLKWAFDGKEQESGVGDVKSNNTLIISAVFLGLAVGSKYTALMVGVICAGWAVAGAVQRRGELGFKGAALAVVAYGAISLAVASPWYIRSWVVTGDPLYPALSNSGSAGVVARDNLRKDSLQLYPISQTLTELPATLWKQDRPLGAGALLGLGVLVFIPALLWGLWRRGPAAWMTIGAIALYIMWARSILIVRYLYPALALGAALAGGMLGQNWSARSRRIIVMAFLTLVALNDLRAISAHYEDRLGDIVRYIVSPMTSEAYLDRCTQLNPAARFVRENLPPSSVKLLFIGETQGYYFFRDYIPTSAYDVHPLAAWISKAKTPEELRDLIKAAGVTHLVLSRPHWERLMKSYGYLTLDQRGGNLFEDMLKKAARPYADKYIEIYAL